MILLIANKTEIVFYRKMTERLKLPIEEICEENDLNVFLKKGVSKEKGFCLIQCELDWGYAYRSAQYGYEVAVKLRRGGFANIIYFHNGLKKELNQVLFKRYPLLLVNSYHVHLPNPLREKHLDLLEPKQMSKDHLEDINDSLLASRELIRESIHALKNKVVFSGKKETKELKQLYTPIIEQFFDHLNSILKGQEYKFQQLKMELLGNMLVSFHEDEDTHVIRVIENFTPKILALTPEAENYDPDIEERQQRLWKVLFVDDEENVRKKFESAFILNRIRYEFAKTPQDALDKLKADENFNFITVVVCDIRYVDAETGIWNRLQGYDLLRKIHFDCSNFVYKVVVTVARKRLRRLENKYDFPIQTYYKDDIQSSKGGMNIFCQKIREEGDRAYFKSRSKPQLTSWSKGTSKRFAEPLANYYRAHLFATDYEDAERDINNRASIYVKDALDEKVEELESLDLQGKFSSSPPTTPEGLELFRSRILLGRRIALALYTIGKEEKEIFYLLCPKAKVSDLTASMKNVFNTSLAISFRKDLPVKQDIKEQKYLRSNLLEEEIVYLIKYCNADFDFEKIRLLQIERDALINFLGNWQDLLERKNADETNTEKIQSPFWEEDLESFSTIKKAVELLKTANSLAIHFNCKKKFNAEILEELDDGNITNPVIVELINVITGST